MKNTLTHEQRARALGLARLLKQTADWFRHICDLYSEGIAAMNGLKSYLETNSTVDRRKHRREIATQTGGWHGASRKRNALFGAPRHAGGNR